MEKNLSKCPIGTSAVMTQNDDTMGSYMGLTREQKREILTHALIRGAEQNALLRGENNEVRK